MAFKQYTRCIEAADFSSRIRYITIASLLAGTPAALIAVAAGHPPCLIIAGVITLLAGLVAYYHNWLYHRLICLGGDRDCIGAVVSIGGPTALLPNPLDRDTDYSINLLLQNSAFGALNEDRAVIHATAEQTLPYGELIVPQPNIIAIGLHPTDHGHFAADKPTGRLAAVLHAEFEGDGMYKMLQASKVLLAFAIFALVACLFLPWPADLILGLVILGISLLGLLLASLLSLFGEGSPSDVNAGELTGSAGVDENGQAIGADVVYVQGSWVFDTLHERWNEIHPIKVCCKMPEDCPDDVILRVRHGFQVAQAQETITNQARPEHKWQIHPDLDGCVPDVIL
jgi:hypothetical protein